MGLGGRVGEVGWCGEGSISGREMVTHTWMSRRLRFYYYTPFHTSVGGCYVHAMVARRVDCRGNCA